MGSLYFQSVLKQCAHISRNRFGLLYSIILYMIATRSPHFVQNLLQSLSEIDMRLHDPS